MMRGLLAFVALVLVASGAMAQPADCAARPAPGPAAHVSIDLAGRPGVPKGVNGKALVEAPMQAPQTDCGEPSAPSDVLGGEPGDLLRGTPRPAQARR
jgi:hypothetical protein